MSSNSKSKASLKTTAELKGRIPPSKYFEEHHFTEAEAFANFQTPPRSNRSSNNSYHYYYRGESHRGEEWFYRSPLPPQSYSYGYGASFAYSSDAREDYSYSHPWVTISQSRYHQSKRDSSSYSPLPIVPNRGQHLRELEIFDTDLWEEDDEDATIPPPPSNKTPPAEVTPTRRTKKPKAKQDPKPDEEERETAPTTPDLIWKLGSFDIVCGRGAPVTWNEGNQNFRDLITEYQTEYLCSKRSDKPRLATKIHEVIKSRGGRFVRRVKNSHRGRFGWEEIPEKRAYEKICQSLRDGAPELRRKMIASSLRGEFPQAIVEIPNEKENSVDIIPRHV